MSDLYQKLESINSKESFCEFAQMLIRDFQENQPDWQNWTIPAFLDALTAWVENGMERVLPNGAARSKAFDWHLLGVILYCGKICE